jgi:hypothetical protein
MRRLCVVAFAAIFDRDCMVREGTSLEETAQVE